MENRDELVKVFSKDIRQILGNLRADWKDVQELRLRVNAPMMLVLKDEEFYVSGSGVPVKDKGQAFLVTKESLRETMEHMSSYSLYAFEEEMRQGFLTVQGGHRIGLAGKAILDKDGVRNLKYISFINVRLSHQVKGCASFLLPYLYDKEGRVLHTLLISPPRCGKTTLLRDMIRQISDGNPISPGVPVGVVDERSELAACFQGIPQNEMGIRTDVLDCCPKALGMMMLIRTMSPSVVAVDEIGSREDMEAIRYVMNCGCKLIATVHGSSVEDIRQKPVLRELMAEGAFERYVVLDKSGGVGSIGGIYDGQGKSISAGRRISRGA